MKHNQTFFLLTTSLVATLLFPSCASIKLEYQDTAEEMALIAPRETSAHHYSYSDLQKWNVLVLDTDNTERTAAYADEAGEYMRKFNGTAADDFSFTQIMAYQDTRLKEVFRTVSYEGVEGESYDLIILRDYFMKEGMSSGQKTTSTLVFYFVEPITEDNSSYNYLVRGSAQTTGIGIVPYPASRLGIQVSNQKCTDAMVSVLKNGLDLHQSDGGNRAQTFVGKPKKAETPEWIEEPEEEITLDDDAEVSIPSNLLKRRLENLKTEN